MEEVQQQQPNGSVGQEVKLKSRLMVLLRLMESLLKMHCSNLQITPNRKLVTQAIFMKTVWRLWVK
ncbi:hypothetical protein HanXRQr2_Chr11g0486171 [Helianthus annuus]|uniref:Uncharacterized protein n=1 Tax=Helianthus annuus TaxID=4232 RepID=A0A251TBP5_HELAN|nr:hypothetical protein HanXRQr2_Chr11g0486171 [Helianthus annuus]KAJ0501228.1 hypothetical protein HanHA300_Chr11g0398411 [Helianthus annuus]KAJ0517127.1 hypothetical protein HanHA89_Chr11g0421741 [Helianthus annuus]KAJ0685136.1 hypothetical protein HanLR1_Chr11g0399161 [Helianthus annuus]KAJ0689053.1 hypothetical protein HanOQP8_Chr11g0401261 [Helianthus annuus]